MDVDHLIYDLSFGIRLPSPTFCPLPIANLINQCFYENPSKRPNFEEMKVFLKEAFNQMMKEANKRLATHQNRIKRQEDYIEINKLKDDKMKSRYKAINETNRQEKMKHLCTEDHVAIDVVVGTSPLLYACLQILSLRELKQLS